MKVFFDTNVYVAEALLGETAEALVQATQRANWRIVTNTHVLDEMRRVLTEYFGFPVRFASLTRHRIGRRADVVEPTTSRHIVPDDPRDNPILQSALSAGCDYLVTNDRHLLALNPYEGLRIVSMTEYRDLLVTEGHLK